MTQRSLRASATRTGRITMTITTFRFPTFTRTCRLGEENTATTVGTGDEILLPRIAQSNQGSIYIIALLLCVSFILIAYRRRRRSTTAARKTKGKVARQRSARQLTSFSSMSSTMNWQLCSQVLAYSRLKQRRAIQMLQQQVRTALVTSRENSIRSREVYTVMRLRRQRCAWRHR